METKKSFCTLTLILVMILQAIMVLSQSPQKVNYQMVVRNMAGKLVQNQAVGVKVSILQGSAEGSVVYAETHTPVCNTNGLATIAVGNGTPVSSTFASIDWGNGPFFLKIETDPDGGTNYALNGSSEILSVPYALHAQTAEALKNGQVEGEILYWDGSQWVALEPGEYDQTLHICNGVPVWGPCPPAVAALTTLAVSEITDTGAKSGGTVVHEGNATVTARGLVWGISPNPTVNNNLNKTVQGTGTGTFTTDITGLEPETKYYARAYATNAQGTGYGNPVEFTTEAQTVFQATLTTAEITNITKNSATSGGTINDDGGASVTARGIVWGTSSNPTLESNLGMTSNGTGTGSFVSPIDNLSPNTKYYVRAYAVNSRGVAYGNQQLFITPTDANLPTVITAEITNIGYTTATSGGNVTSDGGSSVLARGICWGKTESPNFNNFFTEDGTGTGVYSSALANLEIGTTYYVRAFATNVAGIAFGNQVEFSTLTGHPTVVLTDLNNFQRALASLSGEVSSDGGAEVSARGFVWGTSENPSLEEHTGIFTQNEGLGEFTTSLTDLAPNTIYFVKAYATNSQGTAYSNQRFMTVWDYHDVISDFDGNSYKTVRIGEQEWMAENLKTTSFRNGIPIPNVTGNNEWEALTTGAYCWYDNNIDNGQNYGALYNWFVVNDTRGLCPTGWHIPSYDEWTQLKEYLANHGFNYDGTIGGTANKIAKAIAAQSHWVSSSEVGAVGNDLTRNNSSGFSALPGGFRFIG